MADASETNERLSREAPQLVAVLKEMKDGLDTVTKKVQLLTAKVKANSFPTSDGMSYLEAKHLLLLNYCQSLVYYLLSKAKGLSVQDHPVVRSLVEMRLFLEKIRPIDRKLQYQIHKLTRTSASTTEEPGMEAKKASKSQDTDDLLKYRPNPDMRPNSELQNAAVYRPPKIAPVTMEDEDKVSKQEKNALRKEKAELRLSKQSPYMRELMNDVDGRPEEVRDSVVGESKEMMRYTAKMEERDRQEEDMFTRAPLTKSEKREMKNLKKSQNGLLGLTESLFDEIKTLPIGSSEPEQLTSFADGRRGKKFNKRKRKH